MKTLPGYINGEKSGRAIASMLSRWQLVIDQGLPILPVNYFAK